MGLFVSRRGAEEAKNAEIKKGRKAQSLPRRLSALDGFEIERGLAAGTTSSRPLLPLRLCAKPLYYRQRKRPAPAKGTGLFSCREKR